MIDLDWVGKAALAAAGAIASGIVAATFWLMRLGNRVTALETRMTIVEQTHVEAHRAMADGLENIRRQTTAIVADLSKAREDALHYFAERDDLKGLESKIDNVQKAVNELNHARPRSRARQG